VGVRHVVIFRFREGATDADIQAIEDGLALLPERIPELQGYAFGRDLKLAEGNGDFAVVADFDGPDAYERYRSHPEHVRVVRERINPIVAERTAVQLPTG
jgi:hypothetical protein